MDYGINTHTYYNFRQNEIKNQTEDSNGKQKEFRIGISPRLGVGYGRIEYVQDARQAVYIAQALSKKGVLNRKLSDDELFELSQIISSVKNKRFLDSRLRLIEEITTVDSFFEENDLLADNGAAYFTTLYDMWQYGDLFARKSGFEISFVTCPYYYSHQNINYTPVIRDIIRNQNQHLISLNFGYEKPFKLKWQHSLAAEVSGDILSTSEKNKETDNNYTYDGKRKTISAYAQYSLGYFPNTRTNIQLMALQQVWKSVHVDEGNSTTSFTNIRANLYYYFSPNLRLAGGCDLWYSQGRFKGNEDYFNNSNGHFTRFNIQLIYSIF